MIGHISERLDERCLLDYNYVITLLSEISKGGRVRTLCHWLTSFNTSTASYLQSSPNLDPYSEKSGLTISIMSRKFGSSNNNRD